MFPNPTCQHFLREETAYPQEANDLLRERLQTLLHWCYKSNVRIELTIPEACPDDCVTDAPWFISSVSVFMGRGRGI